MRDPIRSIGYEPMDVTTSAMNAIATGDPAAVTAAVEHALAVVEATRERSAVPYLRAARRHAIAGDLDATASALWQASTQYAFGFPCDSGLIPRPPAAAISCSCGEPGIYGGRFCIACGSPVAP